MTLAADVQASLDLTGPVSTALSSLTDLLTGTEVAALLDGSAEQLMTGELLGTLEQVGSGDLAGADVLLEPVSRALAALLDELDLGPIGTLDGVVDALGLVRGVTSSILALVADDIAPLDVGRDLGLSLGDAVNLVFDQVELPAQLAPIQDLRSALDVLDGGATPASSSELAGVLAELLLPAGIDVLRPIGGHLDELDRRLAALPTIDLDLPLDRYRAALDAVTGDGTGSPGPDELAELDAAVAALDGAVTESVARVGAALDALGCEAWATGLRTALAQVPTIPAFTLDTLTTDFAAEIEDFGTQLTAVTEQQILDGIEGMRIEALAFIDGQLGPIPELLDQGEARLQQLLSGLPHRRFRDQLQEAAGDLSDRILGLGIDDVPQAIDDVLADVRDVVTGDVVTTIQATAADITDRVVDVVEEIEQVLDAVTAALTTAVSEVESVLARVRDALAGFRTGIEAVAELQAEIDLAGAATRVRTDLDELADAVDELLTGDLLPDAVRPVLEQAAGALAGIDLQGLVIEPAGQAMAEVQIEVPPEVEQVLADAAELLRTALPQSVLTEIDEPVVIVADALAAFDPSALIGALSEALDRAAGAVEALDPTPHLGPIDRLFEEALTHFDRLDPTLLLEPLAAGYGDILSFLDVVDPEGLGQRVFDGFEQATGSIQEVVTTATRRIGTESSSGPAGPPPELPPTPDPPADRPAPLFRPGDSVRALGSVFDRAREVIEPLDDDVLIPAFTELHELTHLLAARCTPQRLLGSAGNALDAMIGPLSPASAVPAGGELAMAWAGASARVELDVRYHPEEILGRHRASIDALRGRTRRCVDELAQAREVATGFATAMAASAPRALTDPAGGRGPIDALLSQIDIEPVAAALDDVVAETGRAVLGVGDALNQALQQMQVDIEERLDALGPRQLMIRMARIAGLLRTELDIMNPGNLATDVRPIFLALRSQLVAWSPAQMIGAVVETLQAVAAAIRDLDPAILLADLGDLEGLVTRLNAVRPSRLLGPLADELGELGDELAALDIEASITVLIETAGVVIEQLGAALEEVQAALIDVLRRLGSDADISLTVDVEVATT